MKQEGRKILNWLSRLWQTKKRAPRARRRRHLPVPVYQQKTPSDCGPAVLRMLFGFFTGRVLPQSSALRLTKWTKDGVYLHEIPRAMRKLTGSRSKRLPNLSAARAALRKGIPVVSNDSVTYADDHAILLVGKTPKGIYAADPNTGEIRLKSTKWMKVASDEFYAIFPPPQRFKPVVKVNK